MITKIFGRYRVAPRGTHALAEFAKEASFALRCCRPYDYRTTAAVPGLHDGRAWNKAMVSGNAEAGVVVMSGQNDVVVRGNIEFPPGERPGQVAVVTVRIEEVSRADAPATTIGEQVREQVVVSPVGAAVPFTITLPGTEIDPHGHYVVRAHVDVDGTGGVTAGDFVSTRSYPVSLPGGDGSGGGMSPSLSGDKVSDSSITVRLQRVGP